MNNQTKATKTKGGSTYGYGAPELHEDDDDEERVLVQQGKRRNPEVDIWSVGVVITEILYNKGPYYWCGGSDQKIFKALMKKTPPYKDEDITNEGVKKLVECCCSFDPTKRPSIETVYQLWQFVRASLVAINHQKPTGQGQTQVLFFYFHSLIETTARNISLNVNY